MKVTCTIEHLREAILTAERFTGKQVTLPILSYILIRADGKNISLTATNLEFGIEVITPGKIMKSGRAAVPVKQISQALQLLKEGVITLEESSNTLFLYTPDSEISIQNLNVEDFPSLPTIAKEKTFSFPPEPFQQALALALRAVSSSDFKPELSGVYVSFSGDTITLAGTDSYRLAEKLISTPEGLEGQHECILPPRTSHELLRILPEAGPITLSVGENQVIFEWPGVKMISRLIDGTYPPYQNVIPRAFEATLTLKREDFVSKIRLASVFASRLNDVTLAYSTGGVEVSTVHPELGRTTSRLSSSVKGRPGSVIFNFKYLLDGLESIAGDQVTLSISSPAGPALLTDPQDTSFRYLLMPIRPV